MHLEYDAESRFKEKDSTMRRRRKYMKVKERRWSVGVKVPFKMSFTAELIKANIKGRAGARIVVSHSHTSAFHSRPLYPIS